MIPNKIKKLFVCSLPLSLPFITFSCMPSLSSSPGNVNNFKQKDIVKIKAFIPPTVSKNLTKIKNDNYYTLNAGFFENVDQSKKLFNWVKIQNKEDFNQIIIKRFQHLNSCEGVNIRDTEIKSQFEKNYINDQDVYEFLENNDIYISDDNSYSAFDTFYNIEFVDSDSIKLNILINEMIKPEADVVPGYRIWSVFSLPKNKNVIININGKDITQ